jgi:hypothetical protein
MAASRNGTNPVADSTGSAAPSAQPEEAPEGRQDLDPHGRGEAARHDRHAEREEAFEAEAELAPPGGATVERVAGNSTDHRDPPAVQSLGRDSGANLPVNGPA